MHILAAPGGRNTRYSVTTRINTGVFAGFRCYKSRYKVIREVLQMSKGEMFGRVKGAGAGPEAHAPSICRCRRPHLILFTDAEFFARRPYYKSSGLHAETSLKEMAAGGQRFALPGCVFFG